MQKVNLAPHQRYAVSRMHNGCILSGGVGVGKTRTAISYYVEKEAPKDVYVITTAKKRDSLDWEAEAVLHGIGRDTSVSRAGERLGHIHVDSWNNMWRYVDVEGAFFIFDEQRLVGSGAWVGTFYKIARKNNWILLSATPGDTWLDYIPVFVANGFYKNKTEFLREHVIYNRFSKFPKVDRYIAVGRLVRHKNALLVDMPYERHTKRHLHHIQVDYDEDKFKKAVETRWNPFTNEPMKDVAELFRVMREIANSDPSRVEAVRNLLSKHNRLIVFYNFDYELELLRSLGGSMTDVLSESCDSADILNQKSTGSSPEQSPSRSSSTNTLQKSTLSTKGSSGNESVNHSNNSTDQSCAKSKDATGNFQNVSIAEWNGHKHQEIPKTERWLYLVQYTAGAEGWNCIETDACVMFSLNYSYRIFEQCQGRIDRLNTPFTDLHYYVLRSKSAIDNMIWRALRVKMKFNEPRKWEDLESRNWG